MNRKMLIGAAAGCAVAAAVAAGRKSKAKARPTGSKWDKMRARMEEMPEDFPPRVMYDNIETAKANTEEILRILRSDEAPETEAAADTSS
ncbi:MAG: hypothetical protein OEV40_08215 [Acidimicrobiia bacterium]|nr:hypothetical protein [Acidimicrobiia bacterium]